MKKMVSRDHPLQKYFKQVVHHTLEDDLGVRGQGDVEAYLADLLLAFLHREGLFTIRDATGRPLETVSEMLAEGDIRLNADSFDREREVHRHIGDFLLFLSGLFPESLVRSGGEGSLDSAVRQGKVSYHIVSSFEHGPYTDEAATFRKLSDRFEVWREGLYLLRSDFEGFAA